MPTDLPESGHDPVLLHETLDHLNVQPGMTIVDCTLGRGGHASAIAQRIGSNGLLIGLDADPNNLAYAGSRLAATACPHRLFHANFAQLSEVLAEIANTPSTSRSAGTGLPIRVDGILADLGLSTNQLFDSQYGLSFAQDMPLDMRIDPRIRKSAADWVNTLAEAELADVLYELAQEHYSRRIARKIIEARRQSPIKSTAALAELVRRAIPSRNRGLGPRGREKIDPATRTFLALRMKTNSEIDNLTSLLEQAAGYLKTGGRLAIISFQSTEDRIVKQALRSAEQTGLMKIITKRPLVPTEDEVLRNPRSRSAKLRVAQATGS
ncbi:MAG: 16S rRNA (cytosine(1402)-N(4))-methyltransferase RsmH [Phycisphaerales bacterium]|nr:16S rRNA (cytosine(1402)-N(4))-methyltransferase RsmH [Phycisphaerales bacterium]